ncbi:unnamed protein product [Effrenium voratum]|uniref:PsbP C-terminal domain-containing protein n=1 Tax=Effrenium voratum TaxID=2562239 RepID=A0AA36N9K2_9DINO|nr:unnamed protein product [Effrenium voratum]
MALSFVLAPTLRPQTATGSAGAARQAPRQGRPETAEARGGRILMQVACAGAGMAKAGRVLRRRGAVLSLLPAAAWAEEGLTKIGNDQFSIELPAGFSWNEKFILAKTHLYERSVTASDPYGKWKVGLTIDEVFANSLSEVGSANVVADRIAAIERQKDGNFETDVLNAKEAPAGDIPTYLIEYRCDTSRGFNHFLVRVALQKGRLYTVTSQAPEEQWKKLEEPTRGSFESFRLAV